MSADTKTEFIDPEWSNFFRQEIELSETVEEGLARVPILSLLDESELKMEAALEYLEARFAALQTGRAAPALVEGVSVLAYEGAPAIPLPQLGTITVRDP